MATIGSPPASAGAAGTSTASGAGSPTLRAVLASWNRSGGRGDLDGDGAVDTRDLVLALGRLADPSAAGPRVVTAGGGGTSFRGVSCETFVGEGWKKHGYAGLTTVRIYAEFDPDDPEAGVLAGFGIRGVLLAVGSSDGLFHNDLVFGGLTAPPDLRSQGIWSNQWDTYVTINATRAADDRVTLSPGFVKEVNNLESSFFTENAGWFVTPDDEQGRAVDGRVLVAQITVAEGVQISGVINLLLRDRAGEARGLTLFCGAAEELGACCLSPESCFLATAEICDSVGGSFVGVGTRCATQTFQRNCHPGDDAQHCVEVVLTCPEPGGGRSCEPGPLIDVWQSPAGEGGEQQSSHRFGGAGGAIPADFFGPGSDPFTGLVLLHSAPLGPVDLRAYGGGEAVDFGDADTLVLRSADPFPRCALPSAQDVAVDVDVIALSLQSIDPIVVTFDGGQRAKLWDVAVGLSKVAPPSGTLRAVKSYCNGGFYAVDALNVQPRFTFTLQKDPQQTRILDTGLEGMAPVTLTLDQGTWVSDVDPSLAIPSPYCTDFHPGLTDENPTADCDCNGNAQRDRCDIEQGLSADCDGNAVPDECDIAGGARDCNGNGVLDSCECPAEVNGDCRVDAADLALVLERWGPCEGCPEDIDGSGVVDAYELLLVLTGWGPCGG